MKSHNNESRINLTFVNGQRLIKATGRTYRDRGHLFYIADYFEEPEVTEKLLDFELNNWS